MYKYKEKLFKIPPKGGDSEGGIFRCRIIERNGCIRVDRNNSLLWRGKEVKGRKKTLRFSAVICKQDGTCAVFFKWEGKMSSRYNQNAGSHALATCRLDSADRLNARRYYVGFVTEQKYVSIQCTGTTTKHK